MPGAGFKIKAREWKKAVMDMRDAPFASVQAALVRSRPQTVMWSGLHNIFWIRNKEPPFPPLFPT